MKTGLSLLQQIYSVAGGGWIAETMSDLQSAVASGYHTEHTVDDAHADIHCDSISERDRSTPMGVWINAAAADATAFTGAGAMTWTVDIADQAVSYALVGTTMFLNIRLISTSVGGAVNQQLNMRIPGGFTAVRDASLPCLIYDNSAATATLGQVRALSGEMFVNFFRFDGGNFTASANNTHITGQIAIEVQ